MNDSGRQPEHAVGRVPFMVFRVSSPRCCILSYISCVDYDMKGRAFFEA